MNFRNYYCEEPAETGSGSNALLRVLTWSDIKVDRT